MNAERRMLSEWSFYSLFRIHRSSFIPQRHQRIDFRRAPRWNETRQQSDQD